MGLLRQPRGRAREFAVLAAGLAASAALLLAGATVHDGLRTAGEVAVARLSGTVADTVLAEWERLRRASDAPVAPSGERFVWKEGDAGLLPLELHERWDVAREVSVAGTLLDEAERRELVENDLASALELVLEALTKEPVSSLVPEGRLRALQLGLRLDRQAVVEESWAALRTLDLAETRAGIPYRLLGALALPAERRRAAGPPASAEELLRLYLDEDLVTFGPDESPELRFEPAPLLVALARGLEIELEGESFRERRARALRALGEPPVPSEEGRWQLESFAGHPFCVRRSGAVTEGFCYAPRNLQENLARRSALPAGFALDFTGDDRSLGVQVRAPTPLPDSALAFTLRHADPARLASAEATRLRSLRAALVALALACAAGGFLTARVLARERKLGELKSAFIAGVSHDLRTPLASILLLAENLESGVVAEPERARYHRALRKEALRLRRLIDDVLDFSRLERGQAPRLEREELDLAGFVDSLSEDLAARAQECGRELVVERGPLPASAALDGHAVRRALENLLENALKHGRGTVRLGFAGREQRLRITLGDEGPGVPLAERERIFEPFERLNGHTGGTGLGLAIVRSIARAHGGEVRLRENEAGAGALFELDLPLEDPT